LWNPDLWESRNQTLLVSFGISVFVFVVLRCAWLADDAYITFRTVDNWINGYGLSWNAAERVQAYTHPLWMLLISALYFFTREIFYSSLYLSVLVSALAILVFALRIAASPTAAFLGIAVFSCSKAFVDYSSSGLENPLTHLLLALFLSVYFGSRPGFRTLFFLSLIGSLGTLNRMDTLLLFCPVVVFSVLELRKFKGIGVVLAGFIPFMVWEAFSLFYYGFLFPNTAYAKLSTGIPRTALVEQGLHYFANSFRTDPLTLTVIAAGISMAVAFRKSRRTPVAIGVVLYLTYLVAIGGDFMSGRFFTGPLLCAVSLLARFRLAAVTAWAPATSVLVLVGSFSPISRCSAGPTTAGTERRRKTPGRSPTNAATITRPRGCSELIGAPAWTVTRRRCWAARCAPEEGP